MPYDPTKGRAATAAEIADLQARGTIRDLEASQARAVREFILGDATAVGRLRVIDNQIAAARPKILTE